MQREKGFSYPIAMFLVALLTLVSVRALEMTMTAERRDKEAELLVIGQAYRDAIRSYYDNSPGTAKVYPPELSAMLQDARTTRVRRHLRKLYRDPVTAGSEWGVIRTEQGTIKGVYSLSNLRPFKRDGFPSELALFAGAAHYSQWTFVYEPALGAK
jgi:type II secretory pathway pseudopilin PulG